MRQHGGILALKYILYWAYLNKRRMGPMGVQTISLEELLAALQESDLEHYEC